MNQPCNNERYSEGTVYNPAWNHGNNAGQMIMEANRLGEERIRQMQNNAMTNWNQNNSGMVTVSNGASRPETLTNPDFMPAYLQKQIGKWVRVDFLIGGGIEQRVGILEEVGASYIILNVIEPATLLVCELFAIKFVTIVLDDDFTKLTL